ncbi:MAG: MXAN_5187 family protein [Deltaproteobacteria bacterium]|nr:MXAN_5187 family protein [Deltaproteobacteria bacterium]
MFLNKLWFILVALTAGVSLTVAFLAPQSAGRQLKQAEASGLDRAQYAADEMLKGDTRKWIDYAAGLSRDAKITEALENASRGAGEERMLHESVRGALGALLPDPAAAGIALLGAVDINGKVIARIGQKENESGDSMIGIEVVGDALRGFMTDGMLSDDGKLMRLAAAPVLSKARDRIVGALFVGLAVGEPLAQRWKQNLGVDIAFLLGGEVISGTLPGTALGSLADKIAAHEVEIRSNGRTLAFEVPVGGENFVAVAAPFVGEVRAQGGYYVLLQKRQVTLNAIELLKNVATNDLKELPWGPLSLAIVGMLVIGLVLQAREIEGPLKRLRDDLQRLARGDVQKIDDGRHPGRFGGIARDINASIERFGGHAAGDRRDLNQMLGDDAGRERVSSLPPLPPLGGPSASWGGQAGVPSGMLGANMPHQAGGMPSMGMGAVPAANLKSPALPSLQNTMGQSAPVPRMAPPIAAPPSVAAASPRMAIPPGAPPAREMDDQPTKDMVREKGGGAPDAWETHVREVFAEYVATRARCGEPTAGLALDKFREKLEVNRKAIVDKYNCPSARFTVYVKDGKAALKASPLKA